MVELAKTLYDASIELDGHNVLDPQQDDFKHFYVQRPDGNKTIVREAIAAIKKERPFHWFYTGHTGAGKSTELNRLIHDKNLRKHYLPLRISISDEFDVANLVYTDVIFAMAKACALAADRLRCKVPKELAERIRLWGKDVVTEESVQTQTEGTAGLKVSLAFLALGEEIKSGGAKRKTIREKMYDDITGFIHLLDDLTDALVDAKERMPLCVLDGLEHLDMQPYYDIFKNHFTTLTKPKMGKVFGLPLSCFCSRELAADTARIQSILFSIGVFSESGSRAMDERGFAFFKELIARYANLDLFSEEALKSLFVLSGGILRDMIRNCGDACGLADDDNAERVELKHAEAIWNEEMTFFHRVLKKADYDVLRAVSKDPYPEGLDGIPSLLRLKAIIFYPNGKGWYGVHPVVQRLLDRK